MKLEISEITGGFQAKVLNGKAMVSKNEFQYGVDCAKTKSQASEELPHITEVVQDLVDQYGIQNPIITDGGYAGARARNVNLVGREPVDFKAGKTVWFPVEGETSPIAGAGSVLSVNEDGTANVKVTYAWDGDKNIPYKGTATLAPTACYEMKKDCMEYIECCDRDVKLQTEAVNVERIDLSLDASDLDFAKDAPVLK